MNEIVPFDFGGHEVRVVLIDGEPWWVVADVCDVLEIQNAAQAVGRLDEDDICKAEVVDSPGRRQIMYVVNEPGLYELIFRSNKPQARPFQKWVTHEVLPTLRNQRVYAMDDLTPGELFKQQADAFLAQERRTLALERRQIDTDARLDGIEQRDGRHSALAYAKIHGLRVDHPYVTQLGRVASRLHRAHFGTEPERQNNHVYGWVNIYPDWVLGEAAAGLDDG